MERTYPYLGSHYVSSLSGFVYFSHDYFCTTLKDVKSEITLEM